MNKPHDEVPTTAESHQHDSSLMKRVTSSVIIIPVIFAALFGPFGKEIHLVLASVIQGWALWEFFCIAERKGAKVPLTLLIVMGVVLELIGYLALIGWDMRAHLCLLAVAVPGMLFIWQISHGIEGALRNVSAGLLGFVYVSVPLALLFIIRQFPKGSMLIALLLTANFCSDMGAYFVGKKFGKHKLCPKISPAKSIEGAFGAIGGALLGALALGFIVQWFNGQEGSFLGISQSGPTRYMHATALVFLLSVFGMVGDLGESLLKREAGVKDSGKLFVGHGGILDVIDALLFNIPIFYVYARLFFS